MLIFITFFAKESISRPINLTEMNMYIGFVPFILGLIGLFHVDHKSKKLFAFLFIGPIDYNFIYLFLFYTFIPLRLIENTHEFANYFLFAYFILFL